MREIAFLQAGLDADLLEGKIERINISYNERCIKERRQRLMKGKR